MRALLVQSPAISPWLAFRQWEPPSLGLSTIAAQIDAHDVRVVDAIVWRRRAKDRLRRVIEEYRPDVVGYSAMSFQYESTLGLAWLAKQIDPRIRTVLGGYHASLDYDRIASGPDAEHWDFLLRGEGDTAFGELLDALDGGGSSLGDVRGLSFKAEGQFVHNPARPLEDLARLRIPARSKRLCSGFHLYFRPADVIETSRGCTHACNFCSIRRMYGKSLRLFPLERVLADVEDAYGRGARHLFIADDNITLDMGRFDQILDGILSLKLKGLRMTTQASPLGFSERPDVAKKMVEAGLVSIFLGIENVSRKNLRTMAKPNTVEAIRQGVQALERAGAIPVAGIINGLEHDDVESLRENYQFMRELGITSVMDQIITPYPRTPMREKLIQAGRVRNREDYRFYDGYFANVSTAHFEAHELNYVRWRVRRAVLGMWRPTAGDRRYFKDYTLTWTYGLRQLIWLNERLLERLLGTEGRYKLQMRGFLRLNDLGTEIPERRVTGCYDPVFGDDADPLRRSWLETLAKPLDVRPSATRGLAPEVTGLLERGLRWLARRVLPESAAARHPRSVSTPSSTVDGAARELGAWAVPKLDRAGQRVA